MSSEYLFSLSIFFTFVFFPLTQIYSAADQQSTETEIIEEPPEKSATEKILPPEERVKRSYPFENIPRNQIPQNRVPANALPIDKIPKNSLPDNSIPKKKLGPSPIPKKPLEKNPLKRNPINANPIPREMLPRNKIVDTRKARYQSTVEGNTIKTTETTQ